MSQMVWPAATVAGDCDERDRRTGRSHVGAVAERAEDDREIPGRAG